MSSTNPRPGRGDLIADIARPLPAAPSLEYERKEAKALLKQIRAGDSDALHRIHLAHPVSLRDRTPNELRLTDAQHVIAREYGFTSWPRLVAYFEEMERHRRGPRYNTSDDGIERFDALASGVIRRHERGDPIVARELAHFVPRLYGRPASEILGTPITEDEARLVVARENRRSSWEELVDSANATRAWRDSRMWEDERTPLARARQAIRAHDVQALAAIIDDQPQLLMSSPIDRDWRLTLVSIALSVEWDAKSADARHVTDFLASRGADVQRELNERLLGFPHDRERRAERVRWYLERGANPNWMPPNGFTVIEHAIVRYRDAPSLDLIAERVSPRRALWIAAGLGDVAAVRTFLAGNAKLTAEGRLNRPDLMAMASLGGLPPNHEADDLEIMWEAFQIAGWNERWAAMDALLEAGLPVDYTPSVGWPLVLEAVGNMLLPLTEYLVRRGADMDHEWPGYGSARTFARHRVMIDYNPQSESARRLLSICDAGTPDEILAELDAKRPSPPPPDQRALRAMQLAADDAARLGQSSVTTENLLVGLLRTSNGVFAQFLMGSGIDMPKLRAMLGARLLPDSDPLLGAALPRDAAAEAAIHAATAEADARHREDVSPLHFLRAILSQRTAPGATLLAEAGADVASVWKRLELTL